MTKKILIRETIIFITISGVTYLIMYLLLTSVFPDIFIGKYDLKWEYEYFFDVFNNYDFWYSYPTVFLPYILFSIYRIIRWKFKKYKSKKLIYNISPIILIFFIVIIVRNIYLSLWKDTKQIFTDNRNHYSLKKQCKNITLNSDNYKMCNWEGGYHGFGDPYQIGKISFIDDTTLIWNHEAYDGRYWDFPIRYLLNIPYIKDIDTFQVIEDTVLLFNNDGVTSANLIRIKNNELIIDLTGGFIHPDSSFKSYKEIIEQSYKR